MKPAEAAPPGGLSRCELRAPLPSALPTAMPPAPLRGAVSISRRSALFCPALPSTARLLPILLLSLLAGSLLLAGCSGDARGGGTEARGSAGRGSASGGPAVGGLASGEAHQGPIVLITVEGLRADVVGALGGPKSLTPNLDRLARGADWVGTAIAPSSAPAPSATSILTGLRPWQHQVLGDGGGRLGPSLPYLPAALAALGYEGAAYSDDRALTEADGYGRGFGRFTDLGRGQRAAGELARLPSGKRFVWLHVTLPAPPYSRRDWLAHRLEEPPPGTPRQVRGGELEAYFDPAVPLAPEERDRLWHLYRFNVAAADGMIGRLLRGLAESGREAESLIAVVGTTGQDFGEHGQTVSGGSLGRRLIEVPLILRLPEGTSATFAVGQEERPSALRLAATLLEAAGGAAPPAMAPSLFRRDEAAALSELYMAGPRNELSLVEGDLQLRWIARFRVEEGAAGESFEESLAAYYEARRLAAASPRRSLERRELRRRIRALRRAFEEALPLTGMGEPELVLERWTEGAVEVVDDPELAREMARRLRLAWSRFAGAERTPDEERRLAPR